MPPHIIAHRGASGTCPENTLVAFRRAAAIGADMVELDVQLTRDDAVVVIHDDTLDRTTDGSGPVAAGTLAEIRRLDAGTWFAPAFAGERVPTLADVLEAVALPINVELKTPARAELVARTLAEVERAGALDRIVFSSFDALLLERLRSLSATAAIGLLWQDPETAQALWLAERVGATALHLRKDRVTRPALAAAQGAGLGVRVWTVNDQGEMARLAAAGVDAVFTDFPERFLHPPSAGQGRRSAH